MNSFCFGLNIRDGLAAVLQLVDASVCSPKTTAWLGVDGSLSQSWLDYLTVGMHPV